MPSEFVPREGGVLVVLALFLTPSPRAAVQVPAVPGRDLFARDRSGELHELPCWALPGRFRVQELQGLPSRDACFFHWEHAV